jgi:MFS family permease
VATAFSPSAMVFFICRFFTGAGIGGEYAAINSAIDELIPARLRGRIDLMVNGSYWLGAAVGAAMTLVLLDENILAADIGWRVCFGIGAVLGLGILLVRRHVPESPRWLFIHGHDREADRLAEEIERTIAEETGRKLPAGGRADRDQAAQVDLVRGDRPDDGAAPASAGSSGRTCSRSSWRPAS